MKTVYLNHTKFRPTSLTGWMTFTIGLISLTGAWVLMQNLKRDTIELQTRLNASQVKVATLSQASSQTHNAQTEANKAAMTQILLPWASLLKGLENASQEDVKMLALEPNPKTRTIKLRLIALDQASMWAYLDRLKQQKSLQAVRLIANESVEVGGTQVIAFSVEAKWL